MKFIVTLEVTPETGTELAVYLTRAVQNVLYNIGPEPIRFAKGSIYSDDQATARVGTWAIIDDEHCIHCGFAVHVARLEERDGGKVRAGTYIHDDGFFGCGVGRAISLTTVAEVEDSAISGV
jgi:hypothetical protein